MKFKPMLALFKNKVIKIYSKLVTKPYVGLYDSSNTVIVYGSVTLADGSRIVVGRFKGYMDSNGVQYACGNIAKFLSNGSIDTNFMTNIGTIGFDANPVCIAMDSSNNIYVGGAFTTFNNNLSNARGIAKLTTSGVFDTAFSDNLDVVPTSKGNGSGFNGGVNLIVVSGTSLYVGGGFTSFKGIANNAPRIAKLTTAGVFDAAFSNNLDVVSGTKAATSGFNSNIISIAVSGTSLYVVGGFTSFKGIANNAPRIAKLTTAGVFDAAFSNNLDVVSGTKAATSGFNTTAYSVVVSGTDLYVGGGFLSFKAAASAYNAPRIAKLTTAGVFDAAFSNNLDVVSGTKAATSGFNGIVNLIAVSGTDLYLGGVFTMFKGITNNANRIAKLTTAGVFDTAFSDNLDVVSGTKAATSGFNQPVQSVVVSGTDLYVGGSFTYFKNLAPLGIHKMTTSGVASSYIATHYPGDASERSIAIDNEGNRYIGGGNSMRYNGISSPSIRKILPNGEIDNTFAANMGSGFNGSITSIVVSGANLYVGGAFTTFNGITNNAKYIAKLTTAGVFDTAFSNNLDTLAGFPGASSGFNSVVNSIAVSGTDLYVGGSFTSFKGIANNARYIAKLTTSGVFDAAFSNNLDVVSGTKAATSGFDNLVNSIAVSGTDLYVGGAFTTFKGISSNANYIAKLTTAGIFDTAFSNNLDVVSGTKAATSGFSGPVFSIAVSGTSIYVGGGFVAFNEIYYNANYIAKLTTAGVFDTAFSDNLDIVSGTKSTTSGPGGPVSSVVVSGTDLYLGGNFTYFKGNGYNANYIAKLTTSGVFDTAFSDNLDVVSGTKAATSGFDNLVYTLAYDYNSNTLVILGGFYRFKGSMAIGTYTI